MNNKDLIKELKDIAEYLDPPFLRSVTEQDAEECLHKIRDLIKEIRKSGKISRIQNNSGEFSKNPAQTKPTLHSAKPTPQSVKSGSFSQNVNTHCVNRIL
jgi:hypothetical protein